MIFMKGNNGDGNISDRDEWETPSELFMSLNRQYCFRFDCCANAENSKTIFFSNNFERETEVLYPAWMNPPFSKAKKMFKHFFEVVDCGVAIYRCDNLETKLWQDLILKNVDWVFIIKGRVNYKGLSGGGCRFPSALFGVGLSPPENIEGTTLFLNEGVV